MSLLRLRLSMIGTLAFIIAVSTLFFTAVLAYFGAFNILTLAFFVVLFNVFQWLIAPYIINAIYRVKEVSGRDEPRLCGMVENLSRRIGLKMPKVMIANVPIPNAFAYGSPLTGSHVAVTTGLLKSLEEEEVEAVLGHELGHLKHRDVQIMMFVSVLPAIFYFIGYSLLLSARFRGYEERRNGGAMAVAIGAACLIIYWVLTMFVLYLSRLREYYADRRSAMSVDDGARKLSEALAKIVASGARIRLHRKDMGHLDCFKTLFIEDPDRAASDEIELARARMFAADQRLVDEITSREITTMDRIVELFSTHPNIVKRLRTLQKL